MAVTAPAVTGTPQAFNFTTSGTVVTYTGGGTADATTYDVLCVNSDNVVTTPAGWTLVTSKVNSQGSYLFAKSGGTTSATLALGGGIASPTDALWVRITNSDGVDTSGGANTDASSGNATPAFTSASLAASTDLALAFAALHALGITPTAQAWSSGYTEQTFTTNATAPGVFGSVAVKVPAGTAAESPSMTWTNAANDRYLLFAAFLGHDAGSSGVAPNGLAVPITLGTPSVALNISAAPTGLSVPLTLGSPSVALGRSAAPTGLSVGLTLGTPSVGSAVGPTGISLPIFLGTPSVSLNRSASPSGISVPISLGSPSASPITTPSGISLPISLGSPTVTTTATTAELPGSWYGLLAIDEENRQNWADERRAPTECPNDGTPLLRNPRTGRLQCSYDGWVSSF